MLKSRLWFSAASPLSAPKSPPACRRLLTATAALLLAATPALADRAHSFYNAGLKQEQAHNYDTAYADYSVALRLKPNDARYIIAARRARFEASLAHVQRGKQLEARHLNAEALAEFEKARSLDGSNFIAAQELAHLRKLMSPAAQTPAPQASTTQPVGDMQRRLEEAEGPVELGAVSATPITLHLASDARVAYDTIGRLANINVIYDPDYQPKHVTLDLKQVSLLEALRILGLESKSFYTVVTPNTIFVANDTLQKRIDLESQVVKTFYVHNATTPAQLNDIAIAVRTVLNLQHFQPVASQMALVMRDTPDKVAVAQKIIEDLDKAPPEVVVDVQVLQVSRDRLRDLGILPPTNVTVGLNSNLSQNNNNNNNNNSNNSTNGSGNNGGSTGSGSAPIASTFSFQQLSHLDRNDFSVTISPAQLNFLMNDNQSRTIQNPELRATSGQKATLKIGEKIPIATGSFGGAAFGGVTAGANAGFGSLVNTQFQYQDVGVTIELTPFVHGDEVSLKNKVVISAVDNYQTIGGILQPVIGQRSVDHTIQLRAGQSNILGGIFDHNDVHNVSGIPFLSAIPLLKNLFTTTHTERKYDETLIIMTPHIVRKLNITPINREALDTGTQMNIELHEMPPATAAGINIAPQNGVTNGPPPSAVPPAQGNTNMAGPGGAASVPPAQVPAGQPAVSGAPPAPAATAPVNNSAGQPGAAALQIQPATVNAIVGNPVGVSLQLANVNQAYSLSLQLNYDPRMISIENVLNGGMLSRDGQPAVVVHREDSTTGTAQITISRPPNVAGISGSGSVATITLRAKAAGPTELAITRAIARNPSGGIIPLTTGKAIINIR